MKYVLGIDVGGTKISSALVDENNNLSDERNAETSQVDLLAQLEKLIRSYQGFTAIGVGMPGNVSPEGQIEKVKNVKNVPNINLKQYLEEKFHMPVSVLNDAQAFTLAEARTGSGNGFQSVFGVTLGTGLGAGFVKGDKYEDSGKELRRQLGAAESEMQAMKQINHAQEYRKLLTELLSKIVELYNPDVIIFGGTRSQVDGMQEVLEECWKAISDQPQQIKVSTLKYAGVIGAALLLNK